MIVSMFPINSRVLHVDIIWYTVYNARVASVDIFVFLTPTLKKKRRGVRNAHFSGLPLTLILLPGGIAGVRSLSIKKIKKYKKLLVPWSSPGCIQLSPSISYLRCPPAGVASRGPRHCRSSDVVDLRMFTPGGRIFQTRPVCHVAEQVYVEVLPGFECVPFYSINRQL